MNHKTVRKEVNLSQFARGRNGTFRASRAFIYSSKDRRQQLVVMEIDSRRGNKLSPVIVEFTLQEALVIAEGLVVVAVAAAAEGAKKQMEEIANG